MRNKMVGLSRKVIGMKYRRSNKSMMMMMMNSNMSTNSREKKKKEIMRMMKKMMGKILLRFLNYILKINKIIR
jgi:hypothetical protein